MNGHILARKTVAAKPRLKEPADVMQRQIRHEVAPEYPDDARPAGVEGTVLLDAVVSADGKVTQVKIVSGPKSLSVAAVDAERWSSYEPYFVNGQAAPVQTTIAVNFVPAN